MASPFENQQIFLTENQYQYAVEQMSDVIFYLHPSGIVTSVSASVLAHLGYPPHKYIGYPLVAIEDFDDVSTLASVITNSPTCLNVSQLELKYRHMRGHWVYLDVRVIPITDESGQLQTIMVAARDISEYAKEELFHDKQELRDALREQHSMTFTFKKVDGEFIHTMAEGELCYRTGIVPERDLVGKRLADFLPTKIAKEKTVYYEKAWSGECVNTNGVDYLASLGPIHRNREVHEVIASCVDISDYKRIEEKLRKSEETHRLITENMTDLIALLDTDGNLTYVSPSFLRMLGHPLEFYTGQSSFTTIHPDDLAYSKEKFQAMLKSKMESQLAFRVQHADGHWVHLEVKHIPILDEHGEVQSILDIGRDVTERKRTEELLRNSEKLSIIGELAAGIAHEIRNPLTALRGFVQLLQTLYPATPEYYHVMLSELDRINFIVSELLVLSKPQALLFKSSNLHDILKNVIRLLDSQANLNNVELVPTWCNEDLLIRCEENKLKQVFINIVKNGVESMATGGRLTIETERRDGKHLLIRFVDQGCGIPQEMIPKLGEPFYTTKEKGTGLGLMVSNKIIRDHEGQLTVHSELGKGTSVEIVLPLTGA